MSDPYAGACSPEGVIRWESMDVLLLAKHRRRWVQKVFHQILPKMSTANVPIETFWHHFPRKCGDALELLPQRALSWRGWDFQRFSLGYAFRGFGLDSGSRFSFEASGVPPWRDNWPVDLAHLFNTTKEIDWHTIGLPVFESVLRANRTNRSGLNHVYTLSRNVPTRLSIRYVVLL